MSPVCPVHTCHNSHVRAQITGKQILHKILEYIFRTIQVWFNIISVTSIQTPSSIKHILSSKWKSLKMNHIFTPRLCVLHTIWPEQQEKADRRLARVPWVWAPCAKETRWRLVFHDSFEASWWHCSEFLLPRTRLTHEDRVQACRLVRLCVGAPNGHDFYTFRQHNHKNKNKIVQ